MGKLWYNGNIKISLWRIIMEVIKNRAVIYARYSTNRQREESIEGQVRECRELAALKELNIHHIYADRAESGRSDERTEFQIMIKDAEAKLFDFIICYKNDRFARNRYDAIIYKHKLKKLGITVLFSAEPQVDGPEGVILESVLEGFAEYFSANLAVNVNRGMKDNALNNQYNGGPVPIGYNIGPNNQYVIDDATAPLVYEVFKRYAQGQTIKAISDYLNNLGFTTAKGKPFSKGSICSIVNNEKYIGEYVYKLAGGDIVTNPQGIPAIIGRELWDKAKARQKVNIKNTNQGKNLYILTGRLFCSCGSSMCGSKAVYKEKLYFYYRCNKKMQDSSRKCLCGNVSAAILEGVIFGVIFNNVLTQENILQIADGIEKLESKKQSGQNVISFKAQKKEVEEKIKNLLTAIEAGIITPTTKKRLEELESQKAELEFESQKENIKKTRFNKKNVIEFLSKLKSGDINDLLFKKDIADILIHHINLVKRGNVELSLNLGGGVYSNHIIKYKPNGAYTVESSSLEKL